MKLYQTGSKQHEAAMKLANCGNADLIAEKLAKVSAQAQMLYIDTMYQIVYHDSACRNTNQADMLAVQIRNGQRESIGQFGDKAFGLSEKQLAVIARDLAKIAIVFE